MANAQTTTRRALLKAAPALTLVGAGTAQGMAPNTMPSTETPVMVLFREWERINAEMLAAYAADDDQAGDRAHDARWAHEQILIHEPSRCDRDLLLKIVAWTAAGESDLECGNTHLSTVWAEMRALIGA